MNVGVCFVFVIVRVCFETRGGSKFASARHFIEQIPLSKSHWLMSIIDFSAKELAALKAHYASEH